MGRIEKTIDRWPPSRIKERVDAMVKRQWLLLKRDNLETLLERS